MLKAPKAPNQSHRQRKALRSRLPRPEVKVPTLDPPAYNIDVDEVIAAQQSLNFVERIEYRERHNLPEVARCCFQTMLRP